jgi:GTP-binding protein
MDALDGAAVNYQIVLTKGDKLKPTELAACVVATADAVKKRPAAHPEVLATSAETGAGIEALRATIAALT